MAIVFTHISGTRRTAALAVAAASLKTRKSRDVSAVIGFDGFVDVILRAVATRRSMRMDDFDAIASIPAFADRINAAAGKSAGLELVTSESRFGGNGPLLANGLASLGVRTTYLGCIAAESSPLQTPKTAKNTSVHPLFAEFAQRCEKAVPLAQPALTHALEFSDGKIMFNMPDAIQRVTWETVVNSVGRDAMVRMFEQASLIAVVNWSIMTGVESILEGILADMLPAIAKSAGSSQSPRRLFIDLSDPTKRTKEDLLRVLRLLSRMNVHIAVTLGLNLNEAELAGAALGVHHPPTADVASRSLALSHAIRDSLQLATVVVHPREGAAGVDANESLWIDGPFTQSPALSTGAGDHFGAGFTLAQSMSLSLDACLAMAVACSGAYVRDAQSPTDQRLAAFLRAGW